MRTIQESILSILKEHSLRKRLAVPVSMIAIATVFVVAWSLHINGITLTSADPVCGMEEHTHTEDCYGWIVAETEGTEELLAETELVEGTEGAEAVIDAEATEGTERIDETEAIAEAGTEAIAESATEDVTEVGTEEDSDSLQPGDTRTVNGVTYVYTLVCGMEEHVHTDACYETDSEEMSVSTDISGTEDATAAGTEDVSSNGTESTAESDSNDDSDESDEGFLGEIVSTVKNVLLGSSGSDESGISTASEEEDVVTVSGFGSGSSTDSYDFYLASPVDYSNVTSGDEYIMYTEINGTYYVVSADGTLVACTTVDSMSDATGVGPYYVSATGTIAYGASGSDYENYRWVTTMADADSASYYVYNSETNQYLAPTVQTTSSYDTTIDDFNGGSTASVTLSGDFSLTYTFVNTSTGSDNWDNYVVKLIDANSTSRYAYVRADNYAFDGYDALTNQYYLTSFIAYGDGSSDWDTWRSTMASGTQVTVTIVRTDSTIVVTETAAGETFTITLTLDSAVSDSLIVCLTGESCKITNVSYEYSYVTTVSGTATMVYGSSGALTDITSVTTSSRIAAAFSASGSGATISYNYLSASLGASSNQLAWVTSGSSEELVFYFAHIEDSGFYFADNVTLETAKNNLDGNYLIYTIGDDGEYYLVKSDGSLVAISDVKSQSTDSAKALASADGGAYLWGTNSSSKDVFKITSLGSFSLTDYLWTLGSETDGYTLYNSASQNYLAPSQAVSETISGNLDSTATWTAQENGEDYSISQDDALVFTVACTADVSGTAIFNLELYDKTQITVNSSLVTQYITTGSDGSAWFAPGDGGATGITYEGATLTTTISGSIPTMSKGDTYTIVVSRTAASGTSGRTDYVITYYDASGNEIVTYTAADTQMSSSAVFAHVIAQVGTFDVSVAYGSLVTKSNTINADCADLVIGTETTEVEDTAVLDAETYRTGVQSLTGDFDITYTFKNKNSSRNSAIGRGYLDWNYVLAFETTDDSHVYLYASGDGSGSTKTTTISHGDGDSFTAIQASSSSTWTRIVSSMSAGWLIYMNYGTDCTINITREGTTITVNETIKYNGDVISTCVTTFTYGDDITVFLSGVGNTCTLSGITLIDNTPEYKVYAYDAYAPVSSVGEVLTLTESATNGWTALTTAFATAAYENLDLTEQSKSTISWTDETTGRTYYFALLREYYAWFDGTNGGMNSYMVSSYTDEVRTATVDALGNVGTITSPTADEVKDGSGYGNYTLRGWYDIYNNNYYEPGDEITLNTPTVLYADWEVTSYDIGAATSLAGAVSTNSFITTNVFDYNELFNAQSNTVSESSTIGVYNGTASSSSLSTLTAGLHSENFSLSSSSSIVNLASSLNFIFFRSESGGYLIDYPSGRGGYNGNNSEGASQGVLGNYGISASSSSLLTTLFGLGNTVADVDDSSTDSFVLGKTYVGTGDYLFQYSSSSGYYYYDSALNAASYNASNSRFYVYDYTVKANVSGSSNDFLPFNYATALSAISANNINYWFGMSTEIEFYLPDDVPAADSTYNGNVNLAQDGEHHMTFKFSGDDDVWVFIDGVLVLDLGGVHGQVYGEIDFSTGEVVIVNSMTSSTDSTKYVDYDTRGIIDYTTAATEAKVVVEQETAETVVRKLEAGNHTLTFYYLERGASQSNAAIYFNISSETYNLELTKWAEELTTSQELDGAVFSYYTSADFDDNSLVTLADVNGNSKTKFEAGEVAYGLRVGRTYYVKEVETPEGYSDNDRYMTVYLSNKGVLTINVYVTGDDDPIETYTMTIGTTADSNGYISDYKWVAADTNATTNQTGWSYVYDITDVSASSVPTDVYMSYTPVTNGVAGHYDIGIIIQNTKEYEIPTTGSMGIFPYRRVGMVLVFVAAAGFMVLALNELWRVRKRRIIGNIQENTKEDKIHGRHYARTRDHPRERSVTRGYARDRPGNE